MCAMCCARVWWKRKFEEEDEIKRRNDTFMSITNEFLDGLIYIGKINFFEELKIELWWIFVKNRNTAFLDMFVRVWGDQVCLKDV